MAINRLRVVWTGGVGLPGLSTFYLREAVTDVSPVLDYFDAIKSYFPSSVAWSVPSSGDQIDPTTGTLVGGWSGSGGGSVTGTGGSGPYAAGVGAHVLWKSNDVVNGRRVRGGTFLVPLLGSTYDSQGTIDNGNRAVLEAASNDLRVTDVCVIWHRPSPGGSNGSIHDIDAAQVPDAVSTLRTRRT